MRRSAAAVVMDERGRVLLQHRTADAPTWPGHWGLFGGGIEVGENPKQAVVRELQEEIGLDASCGVYAGVIRESREHIVYVFYVEAGLSRKEVELLRAAQTEGQGLGVFGLYELPSPIIPCDAIGIGQSLGRRMGIEEARSSVRWRERRAELAANGFRSRT